MFGRAREPPPEIAVSVIVECSSDTPPNVRDALYNSLLAAGLQVNKVHASPQEETTSDFPSEEDATKCYYQVFETKDVSDNGKIRSKGSEVAALYDRVMELPCPGSLQEGYRPHEGWMEQLTGVLVFPLHCKSDRKFFMRHWVVNMLGRQPLREIRDYYGPEIATYFRYIPGVFNGEIFY